MFSAQNVVDWLHLWLLTTAQGLLLHELGLTSLGLAAMLLTGAYAFGLLAMGVVGVTGVFIGVLVIAALSSAAVLRVQGDIFAVITLAFCQIMHRIAVGAVDLTGGSLGLGPLRRYSIMATDGNAVVIAAVCVALIAVAYWWVGRSTLGVVLGGIRDDELYARAVGHRARVLQLLAVIAAGVAAALVGALAAGYFGLVTPQMGLLDVSLRALAAAMLARPFWQQGRPLLTLAGYAVAAGLLVIVPPFLRACLPAVGEAVLRQALFGMILYVLVHPRISARWREGSYGRA